jgi:uncharacterized protein (TIGR03435 family)
VVRTMLAERLAPKTRFDSRDAPIYTLEIATPGRSLDGRLLPSTIDCEAILARGPTAPPITDRNGQPQRPCGVRTRAGQITGSGDTMAELLQRLSRVPVVDRQVIDGTGLAGRYDFMLT